MFSAINSLQTLSCVWLLATPWLQHARPPCPSQTPKVHPNPRPLSQWRHPTISSSVIPHALNLSQHQGLLKWVSSSHQAAKVLEFQLQHQSFQWTPRTDLPQDDWLDLFAVQHTLKSLLQHHSSKASILWHSAFFINQLSHPYMITGKTIALTTRTFVDKVMSPLFNKLSRLIMTFLPWNKHLLTLWLQSPSAVILGPRKIKSATVFTISPPICHKVMGPVAMIWVFWMLSFKPTFSLSSSTFIKRLLSSSSLSAIRVVSSAYLRLLIFLLAILIPACVSHDVLCI